MMVIAVRQQKKQKTWILKKIDKDYPGALWGNQMERELNPPPDQKLVRTLSGFEIVPDKSSNEDSQAIVASREALAYEPSTEPKAYTWVSSTGTFSRDEDKDKWTDITDRIFDKKSDRGVLLQAMGFDPSKLNYNQPLNRDTFFVPQYGTLED